MISFCKKFTWIEWKGPPHVSAAALFGLQTQAHKRQRDDREQCCYKDHTCSVVAVGVLGLGNHGDGGHGGECAEDAESDGDAAVDGRNVVHYCIESNGQQDHFYENCRVDLPAF